MLPKLSVKKPYTIVVSVVLVILLGFVSFTNMTVDLLPSMNLPYAIVLTTYPGASPEEDVYKRQGVDWPLVYLLDYQVYGRVAKPGRDKR